MRPHKIPKHGPLPLDCARKFVWKKKLASGAYGAVHLADQIGLQRPVAIKLLLADHLREPEQVARFNNEARITASISHPNIVTVLDHGADCGPPWIAYEYAPGRSLRQVLEVGGMEFQAALQAVIQMCNALEAAHARGVLHRDMKPDNVLEVEEGRYKVADFGIAKWTRDGAVKTRTGIILGTPCYISPEQISGEPASPLSDIYALGIVLFELIAGQPPYSAAGPLQLLEMHVKDEIPRVGDRKSGLPQAINDAISRAMAKAPADRYQTVGALRDDLAKMVDLRAAAQKTLRTAVQPAETRRIDRAHRPASRFPLVAAAIAAVLLVSFDALLWLQSRACPPKDVTAQPSATPEGEVAPLRKEFSGIQRKYQDEGARIDSADQAMISGSDDVTRVAEGVVAMLKAHLGDVRSLRMNLEGRTPEVGRKSAAVALLQARLRAEELELQLKLSLATNLVEISRTQKSKDDMGLLDARSAVARMQQYRYRHQLVLPVKQYFALVREACEQALADPGGAASDIGRVLLSLQGLQCRIHFCHWDAGAESDVDTIERDFFERLAKLPGLDGPLLGQIANQFWKLGKLKRTPAGQELLEQLTTALKTLSTHRPEWENSLTEALVLFKTELRVGP